MKYRLLGFASLLAVAAAATAQAQSANPGGQMAYPESLKSGQIVTQGGTAAKAPPPAAKPAPAPAPTAAATPTVKPTKEGMAAARALAEKPSDTPVPYVDFAPAPTAKTMTHHMKAAPKKPTA